MLPASHFLRTVSAEVIPWSPLRTFEVFSQREKLKKELVGSRVPDMTRFPKNLVLTTFKNVQGGGPLVVTQTADRRRSIARALGWPCSWTGFLAGVPVNLGRAPGAHLVRIDGGALLLITQTEHGVTATGRAPEAWAPWTHIPHDIPSLCHVSQGILAALASSLFGPTGIATMWWHVML